MNNQTPQRYQEISLIDLFWQLCSSWRILIAAMVLFAILAGGYRVYKNASYNAVVENDRIAKEEASQNGDEENPAYDTLTQAEAEAVDNAVASAKQLQMNQNYRKSSVYINLDPYHENIRIQNYIVQVNREETATDEMSAKTLAELLKQSYVSYINSKAAAGKLAGSFENLDEAAVGELIFAEAADGLSDTASFQTGSFTTNGGTTTFRVESDSSVNKPCTLFSVRVLGSTDEEAKELADALDKILSEYAKTLSETLDKHQITLVGSNASIIVDTELVTRRQNLNSDLINARANLDNMMTAFTDEQKAAYENIINQDRAAEQEDGEDTDTQAQEVHTVSVTSGLFKYILFGLVIGLFLAAMVLTLVYVMCPTLKTTEDLTGCFRYYLMADLSAHREIKKRFGAGIDRMIHKLRYHGRLPLEEEQRLLATNLKVTCSKAGISSVYLTSSLVMAKDEEKIIQKLIKDLKKENITVVYGGSIERDAESYENMTNTGAVVYIEKLGKSRFGSLENIHAMTEKQGVKILGVVAV